MNILITGGAGFIGSNVAKSFVEDGHSVTIFDNLSRPGVSQNIAWSTAKLIKCDVQDIHILDAEYDVIFHYAAQVGVTSSILDPKHDFDVNVRGSFAVLEKARSQKKKPLVIFASTNKVYGDIQVNEPVSERQPLSFCTPYGCSKGAADQYMMDYFRVYGIPTVVLRMSCIYGNRQMGTEEQGWLCHFVRSKIEQKPVTIYGDGSQVRDVLYIDDYVRLMKLLVEKKEKVQGQVFNIGGGPKNTISITRALNSIGNTQINYSDWRPSDQKYYVSDITKVSTLVGWEPQVSVEWGIEKLTTWVKELCQPSQS